MALISGNDLEPLHQSDNLDVASGDLPVVKQGGISSEYTKTVDLSNLKRHSVEFLALLAPLLIILVVVGIVWSNSSSKSNSDSLAQGVKTQAVTPSQSIPSMNAEEQLALSVNGDLELHGKLQVVQGDQTVTIESPGASGTMCLDTNNCDFATKKQLDSGLKKVVVPPSSLINGVSGAVSLQGQPNQVNVLNNTNGVITLSLPQAIAPISSPQFASLLLTSNLQVSGNIQAAKKLTLGGDLSGQNAALAGNLSAADIAASGSVQAGSLTSLGVITASGDLTLGGQAYLSAYNCELNLNGGKLTTDATGHIICANDFATSGGAGAGVSSLNGLSSDLTIQGDTQIGVAAAGSTIDISINTGSIGSLQIAAGGVSSSNIASAAVTTAKLADAAVTNAKLANSTITINSGSNLTGGGAVALGGSLNIGLGPNVALLNSATSNFTGTLQQNGNNVCTTAGNCGYQGSGAGSGVASLNSLVGDLSLQGTTGQITFTSASGTITAVLGPAVSLLGQTIGTAEIENAAVTNAKLASSTITINTSGGLTGGAAVALGSNVSLGLSASVSMLGQTIEGSEISSGTIGAGNLKAGAATNGYVLTYDSATGGFVYVAPADIAASGGTGVTSLNSMSGSLDVLSTDSDLTVTTDSLNSQIKLNLSNNIARYGDTTSNFTGSLQQNGSAVCTATNGLCSSTGYQGAGTGAGVASLNSLSGDLAVAGSSQLSVTPSGSSINLSIIGNSIGNAELAFDTGQNLTTSSSPTFAGQTLTGVLSGTSATLSGALTVQGAGNSSFTGTVSGAAATTNNQFVTLSQVNSLISASGAGGGVTSLNALTGALTVQGTANQIVFSTAGSTITASLASAVTVQGNVFNGAGQLVQLDGSGYLPALNGSALTNLNAGSIASGTLADGRLSSNVAKYGDTTANFTGTLQQNGSAVCTAANGLCSSTGYQGAGTGAGVASLNSLSGDLALQGTAGKITFTSAGSTVTANLDSAVSLLGQTIDNAELANSSITVNVDSNLTGGGAVSLGSAVNIGLGANVALTNAATVNFTGTLQQGGSQVCTAANGLCSASGVTTIGALDGGTASANGASISGSTLYLQSASATNPGLVNTGAQTFAGNKTFAGNIVVQGTGINSFAGDLAVAGDSSFSGNLSVAGGKTLSIGPSLNVSNQSVGSTYAAQAMYEVGTSPYSVATGDLNGDTWPDIVTANSGANTVSVLMSNTDGTYKTKVDYTTGAQPYSVATGDLNGDGKLDLAVSNNSSASISVFLNNGNGTFATKVDYTTGASPRSVATADFNGDGKLDLAVANYGANTMSVLINNGNGTFATKVDYTTGASSKPYSVTSADFNGDGNIDLAVTNNTSNTVSVFLNNGNGTFAAKVDYATGSGPQSVATADFNGDGHPDLVIATSGSNTTVSVLMNNGNGTFATKVDYTTGTSPWSVAVIDFNGDSKTDLAVANYGSNTVSVLVNNGNGTFQPKQDYTVGASPSSVALADMNGDGKVDMVVANSGSNNVSILNGNGNGTFATAPSYPTGTGPWSVAAGDLNGDGSRDTVVANSSSNTVSVLMNNGNGTFAAKVDYATGIRPYSVSVGDVNGDDKPDLVLANNNNGAGGNTVSVLMNNGNGTFATKVDYATGTSPYSVTTADLNGDGKSDIVAANGYNGAGGNTVSVLMNNGNGTFATKVDYATGTSPYSVTTADLNGDGKLDLAVANNSANTVSVLMNNGNGTFATKVDYATGTSPYSVTTADLNGDGKLDLAVANGGSTSISILLNNGSGTFAAKVDYAAGAGPRSVSAADFNGDGYPDLIVVNNSNVASGNSVSIFLNNGSGAFQPKRDYPVGTNPNSVVSADLNGDNVPDLAVANNGSNSVSVILSQKLLLSSTVRSALSINLPVGDAYGISLQAASNQTADLIHLQDSAGVALLTINATGDLAVVGSASIGGSLLADSVSSTTGYSINGTAGADLTCAGGQVLQPQVIQGGIVTGGTCVAPSSSISGIGSYAATNTAANGASLDGSNNLVFQSASINAPGMVDMSDQTFAGNKTFAGDLAVTGNSTFSGNLTVDSGRSLTLGADLSISNSSTGSAIAAQVYLDTGAGPSSVFASDVNNDDILDILVANTGANTVSVIMGKGGGSFQPKIDYTVGAAPYSVYVADFNSDSRPDIAVVNGNSPYSVSILLGNGDGTFQPKNDYTVGTQPRDIYIADMNGDGKPDLVVANSNISSGGISILLGNGNGTFQPHTDYSYPSAAAVYVADVNNDSKPDVIAVANITSGSVAVFLGNGDGTLQSITSVAPLTSPKRIAVADINSDSNFDILVSNSNGVSVFLGNGNGTFQSPVSYNLGGSISDIRVFDINGDSKLDMIASTSKSSGTISILLGNGDGTFQASVDTALAASATSIDVADMNGDNKVDLVMANNGLNNVGVLFGNGDTSFQTRTDYATGSSPRSIATADFNGDGKIDMAIPSPSVNTVSILLNNGNGSFQSKVDYVTGSSNGMRGIVAVDFNGDGFSDVAITNNLGNTVSVLMNNGNGTFAAKVDYATGTNPYSIASADLDNDADPDIIVASANSSGTVSVLMNNGNGTFAAKVDYPTGSTPYFVATTDLNGDGRPDIVTANYYNGAGGNTVSILMNNGNGTFAAKVDYATGTNPFSVTSADVNGDGQPDIVVANSASKTVSVLMNNGNGTFAAKVDYATGTSPYSVTTADINGDGKVDLAVTNGTSNTVSILLNSGNGVFQPKVDYPVGGTPYWVTAVDLNGDALPDFAVANGASNTVSVILQQPITITSSISSVLSVASANGNILGITIQGATGQTADLIHVQDANALPLFTVGADGSVVAKSLMVAGHIQGDSATLATSLTLGSSSTAGQLIFMSGGFTGKIQIASGGLSANTIYELPVIAGGGTVQICTSAGNCTPNGNTKGDTLYWNGSKWVTLAAGGNNQVLAFCNSQPTWVAMGASCPLIMQTLTDATCPSTMTRAVDARDNSSYWVRKLADGNCWMLTNLAYAGGGANTYNDIKTMTLNNSTSGSSYASPMYSTPTGANPTTEPTNPSTSTNGTGQYGYLYNWCAIMGGQTGNGACSGTDATQPNTAINVCPAGWRLPTGGSSGELVALNTAINAGFTNSPNGLLSTWLAQYSGYWNNGFANQGSNGYYWSSTASSTTAASGLTFSSSFVGPADLGKDGGFAVRCLAAS